MIDINRAEKQGLAAASKEALTSGIRRRSNHRSLVNTLTNLSNAAAGLKLKKDITNARVFFKDTYSLIYIFKKDSEDNNNRGVKISPQ